MLKHACPARRVQLQTATPMEELELAKGNSSIYKRSLQATLVVVGTLLLLWLLFEIRQLLVSFALAIVFASAISPLVSGMEKRHVPRPLAILTLYAGILASAVLVVLLALPPLVKEGAELLTRLVASASELEQWFLSIQASLGHTNLSSLDLDKALPQALQASSSVAPGLLKVTFGVATGIFSLILVFAIAFYWLMEKADIQQAVAGVVAKEHRERFIEIWTEIDSKLGSYVRGQLLDALAVGILTFVGLVILRVDAPLPLAVIAGITGLVPIVGATIGAVPAVLVGLSQSPQTALLVVGLYLLVQQFEGNVLAPRIMQQSVGVSPLTVLLAIVIGGSLLGVVGAMLAIPAAAAIQVLVLRLVIKQPPTSPAGEDRID